MKKAEPTSSRILMRSEYDLHTLTGGVRGKYYKRYQAGTNLALLASDVRAAFPTDRDVNRTFRKLINK